MGLSLSEALTTEIDDMIADVTVENGELKEANALMEPAHNHI